MLGRLKQEVPLTITNLILEPCIKLGIMLFSLISYSKGIELYSGCNMTWLVRTKAGWDIQDEMCRISLGDKVVGKLHFSG